MISSFLALGEELCIWLAVLPFESAYAVALEDPTTDDRTSSEP